MRRWMWPEVEPVKIHSGEQEGESCLVKQENVEAKCKGVVTIHFDHDNRSPGTPAIDWILHIAANHIRPA